MSLSRASLALLILQLALVSSIAAKYLYQRQTCPRVWTRAVAYDPEMVMRGRYFSAQLTIDTCGINLPLSKDQSDSANTGWVYFDPEGTGRVDGQLPVIAGAKNGKLAVDRIAQSPSEQNSQGITLRTGAPCAGATLQQPVDFYLSESAKSPFPLEKGAQLWVEVTVPPLGPPRPLGLAIKSADGQWQPLSYR